MKKISEMTLDEFKEWNKKPLTKLFGKQRGKKMHRVFFLKPYTFATDEIEYILSFAEELKKGAQCFSIEKYGVFSTIWIRKELKK